MDLKPCPMCGKKATSDSWFSVDGRRREWFVVRCVFGCVKSSDEQTEDNAIAAWNTRPREDALQAEVERLRTLVAGGLEAVSAAYQQALAEAQNHDRIADKHDKVVMAWKREARATLKGPTQ